MSDPKTTTISQSPSAFSENKAAVGGIAPSPNVSGSQVGKEQVDTKLTSVSTLGDSKVQVSPMSKSVVDTKSNPLTDTASLSKAETQKQVGASSSPAKPIVGTTAKEEIKPPTKTAKELEAEKKAREKAEADNKRIEDEVRRSTLEDSKKRELEATAEKKKLDEAKLKADADKKQLAEIKIQEEAEKKKFIEAAAKKKADEAVAKKKADDEAAKKLASQAKPVDPKKAAEELKKKEEEEKKLKLAEDEKNKKLAEQNAKLKADQDKKNQENIAIEAKQKQLRDLQDFLLSIDEDTNNTFDEIAMINNIKQQYETITSVTQTLGTQVKAQQDANVVMREQYLAKKTNENQFVLLKELEVVKKKDPKLLLEQTKTTRNLINNDSQKLSKEIGVMKTEEAKMQVLLNKKREENFKQEQELSMIERALRERQRQFSEKQNELNQLEQSLKSSNTFQEKFNKSLQTKVVKSDLSAVQDHIKELEKSRSLLSEPSPVRMPAENSNQIDMQMKFDRLEKEKQDEFRKRDQSRMVLRQELQRQGEFVNTINKTKTDTKRKEDETVKMNKERETIAINIQQVRYQLDEKDKFELTIRQQIDAQKLSSKQFLEKYKGIELDASSKTLSVLESSLKKPDFITSKIQESIFSEDQHKKKTERYKKLNQNEIRKTKVWTLILMMAMFLVFTLPILTYFEINIIDHVHDCYSRLGSAPWSI